MILLKGDDGTEFKFETTIFPDGTSQCWRISPEPKKLQNMTVTWYFENEAELFHVCQLGVLLTKQFVCTITLNTPYLPYARQDKLIKNDATFARSVFVNMVYQAGYHDITAYDAHSKSEFVTSQEPKEFLEAVAKDYDVICFPDKGAIDRYADLLPGMNTIVCEKIRNQQTGEITGLKLLGSPGTNYLTGCKVLVVDDLVDGGKTFIEVAKVLREFNAESLGLAVSHGIFSKGTSILFDVGYETVYTTNSLMKIETIQRNTLFNGHMLKVFDITQQKFCNGNTYFPQDEK